MMKCEKYWMLYDNVCTQLNVVHAVLNSVKLVIFAHVIFFVLQWRLTDLLVFKLAFSASLHRSTHIFDFALTQQKCGKCKGYCSTKIQFLQYSNKDLKLKKNVWKNGSVVCNETWHILGEGSGCTWWIGKIFR